MKKTFIILVGILVSPYLFAEDGSCRSKTTEAQINEAIEDVEDATSKE